MHDPKRTVEQTLLELIAGVRNSSALSKVTTRNKDTSNEIAPSVNLHK
jgi:hypothetical protein